MESTSKTKIVRFKMFCDTGFAGATHEGADQVEVDENATEDEIEKIIGDYTFQWAVDQIDTYHEIID